MESVLSGSPWLNGGRVIVRRDFGAGDEFACVLEFVARYKVALSLISSVSLSFD